MKIVLAFAVAAAAVMLVGCEGDQSAPSRPKTPNLLQVPEKSNDNAFKRENEPPKRDLPTSGSEYPGQSRAPAPSPAARDAQVVTAHAGYHDDSRLVPTEGTDSRFPETKFPQNGWYPGPLPNLPEHPGVAPMVGSTPVVGTGWSIDHSWGEVLPLVDYPHRDWTPSQATYVAADVKHDPVYFSNIQNRLPITQNDSSYGGNWVSALVETPWFALQTAALPVMMAMENPFHQVTTQRLGHDPVYLGHLSPGGPIVPAPTPGVIRWDYPFLTNGPNGHAPTTQAATQPIAPTPGITPAAPATEPAQLRELENQPPEPVPGLR